MSKEMLMQAAAAMPDEFHLDELFERLIVVQKIEEGLRSLREGKGIPQEEVMSGMREKMKARNASYEQGRDNPVS